ncbi:MAG: helix-turn-helix domain-containing protein [Lachnospiraceae bacterium]|nr:helix-turn-helix domain-containing protein [Lachnospiraceae bacterium]
MDTVITRILNLIDKSNLNDKQILKELDISNSSIISDWRTGRSKSPTIQNIIKLSNFFGVSTDYLLTGKEKYYNLSDDEVEWLELYKQLSLNEQRFKDECIGFVKGYIKRGDTENT